MVNWKDCLNKVRDKLRQIRNKIDCTKQTHDDKPVITFQTTSVV
jgi:hypothetical protein